ncbi:ribonuclease III [[Phormidium ambiguum] IAM M-71]|uniref:Ribonuclease 3 n=1 Tax=[Phormidium ambiguum] IAM M-71 TaxID=454136 RepID=A0A1U7INZ5_9CYAN|nr:ribonuclease III [Phormidium ambiguum]OKH39088.1 ribonuclease III [Phormidium ambiguum IAM M-71]
MAISNHERIGKALHLLCQGLYPYVERQMLTVNKDWLKVAISNLPEHQTSKRNVEDILREDVSALLIMMSKQWESVFKKKLGHAERSLVGELIEVRNKWAHQTRLSTDDTYRALDSITRLLKAVSAPQIDTVEKHKQEVLRILSQEQTRQETRSVSAEETRIREKLVELLEKLPFQNACLLNLALTHRSYFYENPREVRDDNERLEFLGDAVLNFICADFLYNLDSEINEGDLTRLRSKLVDEEQLAKFAKILDLGKWMRLGRGAIADKEYTNSLLLSNTFEAMVGGYFLDSGIEAVRAFLEPLFTDAIKELGTSQSDTNSSLLLDPKNELQQWVQLNSGTNLLPKYVTVQAGGESHAPEFLSEVFVGKQKYGEGKGRSKKDAEKSAAKDALVKLKKLGMI